MLSFSDLLHEINGNGYTDAEVVEITSNLTNFILIKEKIVSDLANMYDSQELMEILSGLGLPTYQQQVAANLFTVLSKREKQVFLMRAVEKKTLAQIAEELGVAKGTVQEYVTRTAKKLQILKKGSDI